MEKRYYIDGKCVLSYDDDVFTINIVSLRKENYGKKILY